MSLSRLIPAFGALKHSASTDSKEALLDSYSYHGNEDGVQIRPTWTARSSRLMFALMVVNLVLLCILVFLISSIYLFRAESINAAIRMTSLYSPMLDDVEIQVYRTTMNGSIFGEAVDTPWNGETTDVDKEAVWENFELIRTIPLTREQVLKIGKDPEIVAKFEDDYWGMGEDMYVGALDIFHQIHCLNRLRHTVLNNITKEAGSESFHRVHMKHCVDMLMQHLLCTGDTGFITYNWYDGATNPQPDFSVDKKCRDWRQIVEYRDQHAVNLGQYVAYTKPAGVRELHF